MTSTHTVTSDTIGNPTNDGTWSYTWEKGRQLKQMSKSGTTATFKYNSEGLRVQKTVNGTVTNYTLHGKNIVHLTQGSNTLHFWYDASNRPAIVQFNGTKYAYIHNLQGDIVGILNTAGTEVVKYTYDAWGKVLSTSGSLASTLGSIQPFRYRGYVYDVETGLYYLRSRYYNPMWGRFLSADSSLSQLRELITINLYTYCLNCPTLYNDTLGNEAEECIDITQRLNDEMKAAYLEISLISSISTIAALVDFINNVKSGGKWDLKRREDWNLKSGKKYIYEGIKLEYDEPGNIMFGYVGSALFDLVELKAGAGLYQQYEGHSKDEWGKGWPNFGDEPKDSAAIEYGYRLRKKQEFHISIPIILINLIKFNQYNEEFRRNHELAE